MPALVTTTALVAGLVCLELIKLIGGKNKLEDYRSAPFSALLPPLLPTQAP
jgi:ubiquitin-activating enzyme E1